MSNLYKKLLGMVFAFIFVLLFVQTMQISEMKKQIKGHQEVLVILKNAFKTQLKINDQILRRR